MTYYKKRNYKKNSYNKDLDSLIRIFIFIIVIWLYAKAIELYKINPIIFIIISILLISLWIYVFLYLKKKRYKRLMNIKTLEDMKKLHWREFEKFIEFVFKKKWYKAKVRQWRNDWWIDLDAEINWQKYLIQCKKWDNYKIWAVQLREFYWVLKMMWDNYKWIYITTSTLTKEASKEYENIKNQVELWDNSNLEEYIAEFKWEEIENKQEEKLEKEITCNKCWWKMIIRKANRWEHKWEEFYWCSNYPKCKNIIKIKDK